MKLAPALGVSVALLLIAAPAAFTQPWKRQWETDRQPAQSRQKVTPAAKGANAASTCVPIKFAPYTHNCGKNVGNCVPSRGNCNRGWCCP